MEVEFITPAREVSIRQTMNGGFIVQCGCASLVFSEVDEMCDAIQDYYSHPKEYEEAYNKASQHNERPALDPVFDQDQAREPRQYSTTYGAGMAVEVPEGVLRRR